MKRTIVTTSWDDGHVLDEKLAALLAKYDLAATFYIAPTNHELPATDRLSQAQINTLASRFEIGAHSMTHPDLTAISIDDARKEIADSKATLENWIGKPVTAFCYPRGKNNSAVRAAVKDAGFNYGRGVDRFSFSATGNDAFAAPTTIHAYRHWSDLGHILAFSNINNFITNYAHWDELAIQLFLKAQKDGGVFHLWGHSWEIEKNNDWERLERVFKHISHKTDVEYVTNSQLI